MARIPTDLNVGELRRHVSLGTQAVYRICDVDGENAVVEVVHAPGLARGQRFKFARTAVTRMEPVPSSPSPTDWSDVTLAL